MKSNAWKLWTEQIILFVILPFILWVFRDDLRGIQAGGSFIILLLPDVATILIIFMFKKMKFSHKELFYLSNFKQNLLSILKYFIPSAIVYTAITYFFFPDLFFSLPIENTGLWLLIMVAYPVFSVLPQGIIYRVFYFKRYASLFKNPKILILVNGVFFCFAHIIFNNFVAIGFTLLGGLLFAWRYHKTQSWLINQPACNTLRKNCLKHLFKNVFFVQFSGTTYRAVPW